MHFEFISSRLPSISDGDRENGLHIRIPVDLEVRLGHLLGRALVGDPVGLRAKFGLFGVVHLRLDVSHLAQNFGLTLICDGVSCFYIARWPAKCRQVWRG